MNGLEFINRYQGTLPLTSYDRNTTHGYPGRLCLPRQWYLVPVSSPTPHSLHGPRKSVSTLRSMVTGPLSHLWGSGLSISIFSFSLVPRFSNSNSSPFLLLFSNVNILNFGSSSRLLSEPHIHDEMSRPLYLRQLHPLLLYSFFHLNPHVPVSTSTDDGRHFPTHDTWNVRKGIRTPTQTLPFTVQVETRLFVNNMTF